MAETKKKLTVMDKVADVNPAVVVAAGAAVGAGIAAVGAYAIKNDKTREKVDKVLEAVGEKASEFVDTMKEDAKQQLKEKAGEVSEDTKNIVSNNNK